MDLGGTMIVIERPEAIADYVGREMGPGDWLVVDQAMIDLFADATGDRQWIHVDVERAGREMPGGKTIAHGYLLLSLLPRLSAGIVRIDNASRILNYGSDRIRFTGMVPSGTRVRLRRTIASADRRGGGYRVVSACVLEAEGQPKPVLVAELIAMVFA